MTTAVTPAPSGELSAAEPLLTVKDARISYGESYVVDGASVAVYPGEVSCLIGRNGAGKTTLMKAIMGLLPLRGGSVTAFGEEMRRWPPYRRARAGIGYVPQGRGIFPYLSVLENVLVGLEPLRGKDTGQLDEAFDLFPVLREMARRQAGLLSGGQQQQLAIARALVGRPKLLLLDEPTEGIQPSLVDEIQRVVASFKGDLSVLLIEQFLDFSMAVADRCFVMEQGRIVLEGRPGQMDLEVLRRFLSV